MFNSQCAMEVVMNTMPKPLDEIDLRLIGTLRREPRASHAQLARAAGIARGTVYSRLERLERTGVITGYGPDIDAATAGLTVQAFCLLEIAQGSLAETEAELAGISNVLEVHTVTGAADMLCRIVARSNDQLHEILQQIASIESVRKSETLLSLSASVERSVADVITNR
jgi:DNA-binding Lrp family transcriptional regulator